jgi:hypothetical protein
MFQTSWRDAEDLLRNAEEWVFIGYSLPAADFEFKYLLKRTQLSRGRTSGPRIIAVVQGSETADNYKRLFGAALRRVFDSGLSEGVLEFIFAQAGQRDDPRFALIG